MTVYEYKNQNGSKFYTDLQPDAIFYSDIEGDDVLGHLIIGYFNTFFKSTDIVNERIVKYGEIILGVFDYRRKSVLEKIL